MPKTMANIETTEIKEGFRILRLAWATQKIQGQTILQCENIKNKHTEGTGEKA